MAVLSGLPLDELAALLHPLPRFRAVQVFEWMAKGARSFDEMSNLPALLRGELSGCHSLYSSAVDSKHEDSDGTAKLAIALEDGAKIEAVLLTDGGRPDGKVRRTACLSTQAGCPAACVFCKTGSLGFKRNLTSAEIVEQFLFLRPVDNIVVMGMGEPLLNLAELRRALAVISAPEGVNFSKRRVTVSTCGISDGIADLADNGPDIRLAVSLTAADEELRQKLMPLTSAYPLGKLKESLMYYQKKRGGRVTLEAVLFSAVNTRMRDAQKLAEFASGLDALINLIPWNPVSGCSVDGEPLREPAPAEVAGFAGQLEALGLNVTRRYRKGRGVMGACGQLGAV